MFNYPQSNVTNVFIGQRPEDWLPTTLLLPCGLPFPSWFHLLGSFPGAAAEAQGCLPCLWHRGAVVGGGQGDGSQPASPGQGRQPSRQDVMGKAQHGQQDTGCSQEAKCQIFSGGRRKGLPQQPGRSYCHLENIKTGPGAGVSPYYPLFCF